jgi:hypothetical protein
VKLSKETIYRLTLDMKCGCKAAQEFTDATYKTSVEEVGFIACATHSSQEQIAAIMEMMLTEGLEAEAIKLAEAPAPLHPTPTAFPRPQAEEGDDPLRIPFKAPANVVAGRRENPRVGPVALNRGNAPSATKQAAASAISALDVAPEITAEMQMEEVEADPRVDDILGGLEDMFDAAEDTRDRQ